MPKTTKDEDFKYRVITGEKILTRLKRYILDNKLKRLRDGIDDLLKDRGY